MVLRRDDSQVRRCGAIATRLREHVEGVVGLVRAALPLPAVSGPIPAFQCRIRPVKGSLTCGGADRTAFAVRVESAA